LASSQELDSALFDDGEFEPTGFSYGEEKGIKVNVQERRY
jgi:hypothetical protein